MEKRHDQFSTGSYKNDWWLLIDGEPNKGFDG